MKPYIEHSVYMQPKPSKSLGEFDGYRSLRSLRDGCIYPRDNAESVFYVISKIISGQELPWVKDGKFHIKDRESYSLEVG